MSSNVPMFRYMYIRFPSLSDYIVANCTVVLESDREGVSEDLLCPLSDSKNTTDPNSVTDYGLIFGSTAVGVVFIMTVLGCCIAFLIMAHRRKKQSSRLPILNIADR